MSQKNTDVLKVTGINSKGYGIYPKLVAKDRRLTIEAKAIYAYFCSYAGSGNTAFPPVSKMIYDLNISKTRYYTHFKLLKKYGYIAIEKGRNENGKFDHNIYILNTEIIETPETKTAETLEESPCPKNRDTVKNESPCPSFPDTGNRDMENWDTNNNTLGINSLEKVEEVGPPSQTEEENLDMAKIFSENISSLKPINKKQFDSLCKRFGNQYILTIIEYCASINIGSFAGFETTINRFIKKGANTSDKVISQIETFRESKRKTSENVKKKQIRVNQDNKIDLKQDDKYAPFYL